MAPQSTQNSAPLNIIVIGLGRRSQAHDLAYLLGTGKEFFNLVAVSDPDETTFALLNKFPDIHHYTAITSLLADYHRNVLGMIDCAYVAVPYEAYSEIVPLLLKSKIHVLKENPAGATSEECANFQSLAQRNNARLVTAIQARYCPRFNRFKELLPLIGAIRLVEGTRKQFIEDLGIGWRGKNINGVLGDLGYQLINEVFGLANINSIPSIETVNLIKIRKHQEHDCEDTVTLTMHGQSDANPEIVFNLCVSRVGAEKANLLSFTGSDGVLTVQRSAIDLQLILETGSRIIHFQITESSEVDLMFQAFRQELLLPKPSPRYLSFQRLDVISTTTIENLHTFAEEKSSRILSKQQFHTNRLSAIPADPPDLGSLTQWLRITSEIEEETRTQLHTDLSIYGSGVFGEFETEFKAWHGMDDGFALLHNSGSNALQAMYYAAGFMPGDEVIFPVYTFHATASPAMHFGIQPVFCDCDETGTIDPSAIKYAITPRTKAVVVTHLWGICCDMPRILSTLADCPSVLLLEDCSHAHGATINDKPVGTFGDAAAWSLQGQKIVTGGEGGIVLTKHVDFHYKQLIWGHYSKRCKSEIPINHPLRSYALTGTGCKNQAHPLAIRIALNQLRKLDSFHKVKTEFAKRMAEELNSIPFLRMPITGHLSDDTITAPAWYAFVIHFIPGMAPHRLTRESFVRQLLDAGLGEVDIPNSTGLLHKEPLFNTPEVVLPHINFGTSRRLRPSSGKFPCAQHLYESAIKLPVFAYIEDEPKLEHYISVIKEIAKVAMEAETDSL